MPEYAHVGQKYARHVALVAYRTHKSSSTASAHDMDHALSTTYGVEANPFPSESLFPSSEKSVNATGDGEENMKWTMVYDEGVNLNVYG